MGHDRREFVFRHGVVEQATVNTNHASGHGEGVDGWVVDDNQLDTTILKLTVLYQLEDVILQIAV